VDREFKFEEGMAHLEEIVKSLEEGSLPLNECFSAYERGVKLVKALGALLDEGEARIRVLTADGEVPFEAEGGQ
jgi:exodeoxyribonuclease VII small subunit